MLQNPDTVQIEALGVVGWNYEGNAYHVVRNYRFTTPEMVVETPVPVQSTEGMGEGEQRKWFVNVMRIPSFKDFGLTPLGKNLFDLRYSSKLFMQKWQSDLGEKRRVPEYEDAETAWAKIRPKKALERDHVRKMLVDFFPGKRKLPTQTNFTTDEHFAQWSQDGDHVRIHHPMRMMIPAEGTFPWFNVELDCLVETKIPSISRPQ